MGSIPLVVKDTKSVSNRAAKRLGSLLEVLDDLVGTEGSSESIKVTMHQGFDSYINRPLVGNAPVRKVFFREAKNAVARLKTVATELEWAVCDILLDGSSLGWIRRALDRVSHSDVNIVSRSHIILNLYFDEKLHGQIDLKHAIIHDMQQWAPIPDALFDNEHAQSFLTRLAKPVYDTLKLCTLNKNRQRCYIEAVMFPEWTSLQHEAHLVDVYFRQEKPLNDEDDSHSAAAVPYFSHYVLIILLRLMERYVATGMELGLFCSHEEICYSCWYRDFLLSALVTNLTMMKRAKQQQQLQQQQQQEIFSVPISPKSSRGKKKKNHKHVKSIGSSSSNGRHDIKATDQDKQDEWELTMLTLKRNLCRGTIRFLACLRQVGILKPNEYEFTSVERIFGMRFQAFDTILQPPALTYEQYLEGSDFSNVPAEALLSSTAEWFQSCKKTVEQLLVQQQTIPTTAGDTSLSFATMQECELRSLLKVCIGNAVFVQKLRQVMQDPDRSSKSVTVDFDFSTHAEFCIIKLL
jgi:hypothetical protein